MLCVALHHPAQPETLCRPQEELCQNTAGEQGVSSQLTRPCGVFLCAHQSYKKSRPSSSPRAFPTRVISTSGMFALQGRLIPYSKFPVGQLIAQYSNASLLRALPSALTQLQASLPCALASLQKPFESCPIVGCCACADSFDVRSSDFGSIPSWPTARAAFSTASSSSRSRIQTTLQR